MTTINLTQAEIAALRVRRAQVKTMYTVRDQLFTRYEDIYFMRGMEVPKDPGVDKNDWKVTVSPSGRDKVTGLKRILDTAEIHIKVKGTQEGLDANSDKIEAGLKTMLKVSGEYRSARVERDTNLSAILYGPVVLTVNNVDELITARYKDKDTGAAKFIRKQLEDIRVRTPFLIDVINAKESYPVQGKYGMSGHLQEYMVKGGELVEEWSCDPSKFQPAIDYVVQDFFLYDQRLVEVNGVTLYADRWTDGEATNLPIFVRNAGGSTMFGKPEEQLNSFLYAYAKGEWDRRENLFWTYLFTAIYTQGLPGPTIIRDPDDSSDIKVDYTGGVKVITAKGKLENVQVIDGDVLQLRGLMEQQTSQSTVQEQTLGGASNAATFSSYVMQVNAGKLPLIDSTEAQEQANKDLFLHILQRIKAEGIANDLIDPADIPDTIDLEVTLEPDLQQDDLRNSQIVTQLKAAGANVSDEWINTNLLKIADSNAMFRQKTKEDIRRAMIGMIIQNPQIMQAFVMTAMGQPAQPEQQQPPPPQGMPQGMPGQEPGAMGEGMPQTDAMVPAQERI